ncbi:MAG: hypothetical protein ABI700_00980 [Chloroflexota bacterium]
MLNFILSVIRFLIIDFGFDPFSDNGYYVTLPGWISALRRHDIIDYRWGWITADRYYTVAQLEIVLCGHFLPTHLYSVLKKPVGNFSSYERNRRGRHACQPQQHHWLLQARAQENTHPLDPSVTLRNHYAPHIDLRTTLRNHPHKQTPN